ncbi:MAG TPA: 5-oxoprolinase subunit PxpB [Selenomonadales bacterium]|nr:5-oxoprolinase subunit PxpB [Selenomonadales bacterium]
MNTYSAKVRMLAAGEQGLVVDFGNEISMAINALVQRLVKDLAELKLEGVLETIPTYRSVMIYFDPLVITRRQLTENIKVLLDQLGTEEPERVPGRVLCVPVCYGGVFGPDIDFVARRTRLSVEEVIKVHTSRAYFIYMLGFTPGFPYLGGMPEQLAVPRLEKLRVKIPEGSVGISGRQTGFYTEESPGGWRIIGRTPIKAFNPGQPHPFLFAAGDYLQFKAISVDEFFAVRREVEAGTYRPEITSLEQPGGENGDPV